MEATGHARWFERLLAERGFELWIGDPSQIKAKRVRKQKPDRLDAALLLQLLLEDRFPRVANLTISANECLFLSYDRPHRAFSAVLAYN
jgi:transposase